MKIKCPKCGSENIRLSISCEGGFECEECNYRFLLSEALDNIEETNEEQIDNVNHPSHYNQGKIEVIDFIEAWDMNFNVGNVVKYVSRAKYKNDELEDLKKARFYLDREIKRCENE